MTNNENKNSNIELITGDPKKAIRHLTGPMVIIMLLIVGYNIVDSIWVAGLGFEALAALGFITPLYMIIIGLGQGIGAGTTSILARCIGAEDKNRASNAGIHSILITIVTSIILSIITFLFLKEILILIGASSVLDLAMNYGIIVFIGSFPILLNLLGSSILRAEGDVKRATYAIAITSLLNIALDPLFIYSLNMGITGAAIATVISSLMASIVIFYWILVKRETYIKLTWEKFKFDLNILKDILNVALPGSLEEFMLSFSTIGINALLIIVSGPIAVAIYTAGWRIAMLGIIPASGLEMASLTIAGVAYGAKNLKNLKITINYSIKLGIVIGLILAIIISLIAPQLATLFTFTTNNTALTSSIAEFIRMLSVFFITIPLGFISTATFQAAGKGVTSLILTVTRDIILSLFFAYLLGVLCNFGQIGVYWGLIFGIVLGSIINYLYLKLFLGKIKKEWEIEIDTTLAIGEEINEGN
ncbi:multidrug export protein MepA [Methanobrevibacter cuticularis]|uniref:Multidrug export protein MepA n=1 Tax=Methanobrevibacter cuticularis TaxID=47311 RepID=A0A166FHA2_9EURY|nr:MATE family efflux transporter [Methanobrevibacter cuticularis]KZX17671.1 multidrug export protein MepA [Methanobrevibacter cuticularis]